MKSSDRNKALNKFADPNIPDETELSIIKTGDDDTTFSQQSLEDFKEMLVLFVGGRLMAHWTKTGDPPKKVTVHLKVKIE
jgi:hypothetical protein